MKSKILIISPHPDDEVYGAFSFIGKDTTIHYIALDESEVRGPRPTFAERTDEIIDLAEHFPFDLQFSLLPANELHLHMNELIEIISNMIKKVNPDTMLIPMPDTNQDHRAVYEACMVALRPHDKIPFVPNVLMYETPGSYLWGPKLDVNYFKKVSTIKKQDAYDCYKSQGRPYRSKRLLIDMAIHRGKQSNMGSAEGFKVVRMCQE